MNTFTFGKYKERSIMSVLSENPAYVEWCVNHIEWFTLGCQEQKRLNDITEAIKIIYRQYPYSYPRGEGASKVLYERVLEYLENKEAFRAKYKGHQKNSNSTDYIASVAHSAYKEYDRMSQQERDEMDDIFGANPMSLFY